MDKMARKGYERAGMTLNTDERYEAVAALDAVSKLLDAVQKVRDLMPKSLEAKAVEAPMDALLGEAAHEVLYVGAATTRILFDCFGLDVDMDEYLGWRMGRMEREAREAREEGREPRQR